MKITRISDQQFEDREGYGRAVIFSQDDFGVNTKLQVMQLAAGQSIAPHYHKQRTECFRIISGNGKIIINGEVVANSSDDIVLCEPGDVHEFANESQDEPLIFQVIRTNDPIEDDMYWVKE